MILRYHWSHQMQQKVKVIKAHRKRERERERERGIKRKREKVFYPKIDRKICPVSCLKDRAWKLK